MKVVLFYLCRGNTHSIFKKTLSILKEERTIKKIYFCAFDKHLGYSLF